MNPSLTNRLAPIFIGMLLIVLWEVVPSVYAIPAYKLPRISEIAFEIGAHFPQILQHSQITLLEALVGFVIGSVIGFLCGVLFAEFKIALRVSLPYLIALNAVPIIAFAPILISWFGMNLVTRIIIAALICFFPLCLNTLRGLSEYKQIYKDLFTIYGASRFDFLSKFKLINSLPYIFSGLKLNAVYAVTGALISEFIGSSSGLGFAMLQSIRYLNGPRMWAYILITCLIGLAFYAAVVFVENKLTKK